jgi:hypothetical protein
VLAGRRTTSASGATHGSERLVDRLRESAASARRSLTIPTPRVMPSPCSAAMRMRGLEPPRGGFGETNGLARLQDEPHEDQPEDYEDRKPHEDASEHGEQLPAVGRSGRAFGERET